jgi:hypothetical protein
MIEMAKMTSPTHYSYPNPEAEFTLYNFHRRQTVDELAAVLGSQQPGSPRIIELFGADGSGRHYLLRAAAFHSGRNGIPVSVLTLDLDAYEPDQPLKNPAAEELLRLLESGNRERLRLFLGRATQDSRLVIHIRDGRAADVALKLRLIDETILNRNVFLALSYPGGTFRNFEDHPTHLVHVQSWTRAEMEFLVKERFHPNRIPEEFFDFLWHPAHGREDLARTLLRVVNRGALGPDRRDVWIVETGWQHKSEILNEFNRDLFDPVLVLLSRLRAAGNERIHELQQFLDAAALCHPAILVNRILDLIEIGDEEKDDFVDWLDDLLATGDDSILVDLGFSHPGFPDSESVYRFRDPLLPGVILTRCARPKELAVRLLGAMSRSLRPETRAIARLYLRLADHALDLHGAEQYAYQLAWWAGLEDLEVLREAITTAIKAGDVSPQLVWSVLLKSKDHWPPSRRMALLNAYGAQPGGVPAGNLSNFLAEKAEIVHDLSQRNAY